MAIKITSDSTCDLTKELLEKHDIELFPLYITLGVGILAAYNARITHLEDCANGVDFGWGCFAWYRLKFVQRLVTLCTASANALHGVWLCSARRLVMLCTAFGYALHCIG